MLDNLLNTPSIDTLADGTIITIERNGDWNIRFPNRQVKWGSAKTRDEAREKARQAHHAYVVACWESGKVVGDRFIVPL